jgi:hypothetical protein
MPTEYFLTSSVDHPTFPRGKVPKFYTPSLTWEGRPFSHGDQYLAKVTANQTVLNQIATDPDTTRLATESNIDRALTANQANQARTVFETNFIPRGYISAGDTRRQAVKKIYGLANFMAKASRFAGKNIKTLAQENSVNFSTTLAAMPKQMQDALSQAAFFFGWTGPDLGVTMQSTLREFLTAIGEAFENSQVFKQDFTS